MIGVSYRDLQEWDEVEDGPFPDEYDTWCPSCWEWQPAHRIVDMTTCDLCGWVFDPSVASMDGPP